MEPPDPLRAALARIGATPHVRDYVRDEAGQFVTRCSPECPACLARAALRASGPPPSDRAALAALLARAGVPVRADDPDVRYSALAQRPDVAVLSVHARDRRPPVAADPLAGTPDELTTVDGYSGFFVNFVFDATGALLAVEIWE